MGRALGLFGKLPARGDFVSRRLDREFVDAWDTWLQRAIAESRSRLGAAWLDAFLSAPIWRFIVPKGMFSGSGWMGVVIPSVDRVGRYFPLTLAVPLNEGNIDLPATLVRASSWFASIEDIALEALTPQLDFEQFDLRLAATKIPDDLPVIAMLEDDTVPIAMSRIQFCVRQIGDDTADPVLLKDLKSELALVSGPYSLWMTLGGDTVPACVARCSGLIGGIRFCAMLDGRWTEHDWTAKLIVAEQVAAVEPPITDPVPAKLAETAEKAPEKALDRTMTVESPLDGDLTQPMLVEPLLVDLPEDKLQQNEKKMEEPAVSESGAEVVAEVIALRPELVDQTTTAQGKQPSDVSPSLVVDLPGGKLQQSENKIEKSTASEGGSVVAVVDPQLNLTQ